MEFLMEFLMEFVMFARLFYRRTKRQIKQAGLPDIILIPVSLYVSALVCVCVACYALIMLVVRFFTADRKPWKAALMGIFMVWLVICLLLRVFTPSAADRAFEGGGFVTATYTIQTGDTLWDISKAGQAAFGLSDPRVYLDKLYKINPGLGSNGGRCNAGARIVLPVPEGVSVGDMLYPD